MCVCRLCALQVMGDKGFSEKNFKLMKATIEADKAKREAAEEEAEQAADDAPGGADKRDRKKRKGCWQLPTRDAL